MLIKPPMVLSYAQCRYSLLSLRINVDLSGTVHTTKTRDSGVDGTEQHGR